MLDTISVVTVNSSHNSIYSVTKATTQYGTEYVLSQEQTKDYLLNHYSLGYTTFSSLPKSTGLMPPGVKAIFPNVVVFERPPTYQNIFYIADAVSERMSDEQNVYRIALPWQLYIAVYNSDFVFYNCSRLLLLFLKLLFLYLSLVSRDLSFLNKLCHD